MTGKAAKSADALRKLGRQHRLSLIEKQRLRRALAQAKKRVKAQGKR